MINAEASTRRRARVVQDLSLGDFDIKPHTQQLLSQAKRGGKLGILMFGAHHPFATCKACYRVRGTWVQGLSLKQPDERDTSLSGKPTEGWMAWIKWDSTCGIILYLHRSKGHSSKLS